MIKLQDGSDKIKGKNKKELFIKGRIMTLAVRAQRKVQNERKKKASRRS